jgi:hypothetical protein
MDLDQIVMYIGTWSIQKNNTIALSGSFATNSSGGFEERTFVDDISSGD